jgi:hypothetical protein|tara:strand:- start:2589 stop:2729 length:141 start_codon:yes stop_codon:yes gene_type:complete
MLEEIKELKVSDVFGGIALTAFCLGWMDIGFGPQYTWWNLIALFAN